MRNKINKEIIFLLFYIFLAIYFVLHDVNLSVPHLPRLQMIICESGDIQWLDSISLLHCKQNKQAPGNEQHTHLYKISELVPLFLPDGNQFFHGPLLSVSYCLSDRH